jgi:hypothetical protein
LKLLILFLHRGIKKEYDFHIATEQSKAGKFDDLVFAYKKDGKANIIFLQAKHKQEPTTDNQIKFIDLYTTSPNNTTYQVNNYFELAGK